jgi:nucleoside-diphosphate-sugar epimerase
MSRPVAVISGVTGMTGNETARQLLGKGYEVFGFDNFFASSIAAVQDLLRDTAFHFHEADLRDGAAMSRLAAEVMAGPSAERSFIHCAAVVHTEHFYVPSATFDVNVIGTRDFLELAIGSGARTFLNCSTSEVYSLRSWAEGGVCESDTLALSTAETSQRTSYATGKLLTEFLLREVVEQGRIRGCSIRFANVYSAEEEMPKHIIPFAIDSLLAGDEIELLENARTTRRSFLHNHDSCSAVIALLEHPDALDGSIYNVGTLEEIEIVELVRLIARDLGRPEPAIRFHGQRTSDPTRRLLNTDKLRKATDWEPRVSLVQGLRGCIEVRRRRLAHGG